MMHFPSCYNQFCSQMEKFLLTLKPVSSFQRFKHVIFGSIFSEKMFIATRCGCKGILKRSCYQDLFIIYVLLVSNRGIKVWKSNLLTHLSRMSFKPWAENRILGINIYIKYWNADNKCSFDSQVTTATSSEMGSVSSFSDVLLCYLQRRKILSWEILLLSCAVCCSSLLVQDWLKLSQAAPTWSFKNATFLYLALQQLLNGATG